MAAHPSQFPNNSTIMEHLWSEGQNVELDVQVLRSGIYLLVCEQNGKALFHGKIVKQ
jgi:hypothetical protein